MGNKKVWFGTEYDLVQINCPSTGLTRTPTSYRASGTFLSGGGYSISSGTSHQEMEIAWNASSYAELAPMLTQMNKGEPLYYIDPLSASTNVLPSYVAQYQHNNPFSAASISVPPVGHGYPTIASRYFSETEVFRLPIPEGYDAWFGGVGLGSYTANGTSHSLVGYSVIGEPQEPVGDIQTPHMVVGGETFSLVVGQDSIIIGFVAVILPHGVSPQPGDFLPGFGFSSLELRDNPQITEYSAVLENYQVGLSASFIETGAWNG